MHSNKERMIMGILSLGYVLGSLLLIVTALGWTGYLLYIENYLLYMTNRWVLGLTGTILFAFTLTLFLSSFKAKPVKTTIIHETSLGHIQITLQALEHLVTKAARSVQGVRDVKPLLKKNPDYLSVQLKVHVAPDIAIPQVTESIQNTVKDYLAKTAGMTIQDIQILVNRISWDNKSRVE